jgi:hypothetical protein
MTTAIGIRISKNLEMKFIAAKNLISRFFEIRIILKIKNTILNKDHLTLSNVSIQSRNTMLRKYLKV